MADVRAKRNSDPSVAVEAVAGKRRHTSSALDGKENLLPRRGRPGSSKKPRLAQQVKDSRAQREGDRKPLHW